MSYLCRLWLAVAGAALVAPRGACAQRAATAPPPPLVLTRREAIDSALARNPQLRVAREQVAQVRAQGVQSTAFPDPSVAGDLTGQSSLTRQRSNTGSDVSVGLTVPFPTKFLLRHRVSSADVDAAEFSYQQLRQQIASFAAQAYDALIVALRHRADLLEGDSLAASFEQKTQVRFTAGSVPRLDVLKAQVDRAQARNDLLANQRDVANARAALNRLLGRPLGFAIDAGDTLGLPSDLPDEDSLVAIALQRRPELLGLARERAGARSNTALAQQYWLPDVDLSVEKNIVQGTPSTYTTSIGFSVPLFFWNHQRGEVAESKHHERELTAAYADLEAEVDQDVRTTFAAAATALQQAIYLRDQLLPEARRAYEIALTSYGLGGSSALDVLDARRTLLDAESQYAETLGAANDARADLERAVGAPLETDSAGAPHED
jgi:outer membrane protein, heavy metal efflux system